MSTTALVRSPSAPNVFSNSSSTSLSSQPKSSSPSTLPTNQVSKIGARSQSAAPTPLKPSPASTPASASKQLATPQQQPSPRLSSPGRWQHPAMDEVIRRQRRTQFDKSNVWNILLHLFCILLTFFVPTLASSILPSQWSRATQPYSTYILFLLRAISLTNIGLAVLPLLREPDACEDIPLAPAQRHLLGLPPLSRPATPQEQERYVTPPRYVSRSQHTPGGSGSSATSSLRAHASDSPASGRFTPLDASSFGFSPSGSPSAALGGGAAHRRLSQQGRRSSSLGTPELDGVGGSGGSYTPTKSTRASVGLNSKWLYEKGRGSPVGMTGWGTGSVFN